MGTIIVMAPLRRESWAADPSPRPVPTDSADRANSEVRLLRWREHPGLPEADFGPACSPFDP